MKKILVILLSTLLLFACESKEEREEIKQIMTLYNYNDYEKTVKAVDDYKIKYPNSSRLKDFEKIRQESIEKIEEKEKERIEKEKQIEKLKKIEAKFDETIKNTYSEYDEFENAKFFRSKNKNGTQSIIDDRIGLIGINNGKESKYPLITEIDFTYVGKDWIFFDNVVIISNDERKEFEFKLTDGVQEVAGKVVIEQQAILLDNETIDFFKKIIDNDVIKVRFSGKENYDFTLSENEKYKIKNMLIIHNKNLDAQIID